MSQLIANANVQFSATLNYMMILILKNRQEIKKKLSKINNIYS